MMFNIDAATTVSMKLDSNRPVDEFFTEEGKDLYVSDGALTTLVLSLHSIILFQFKFTPRALAELLGLCF